jgi:hypothetical protein
VLDLESPIFPGRKKVSAKVIEAEMQIFKRAQSALGA